MFETTGTFEVTNGLACDGHALLTIGLDRCSDDIASRHVEMKWIATERGLEARWAVRPEEPAHFVLREHRIVPAALAARF
jgi:hypothetical protein